MRALGVATLLLALAVTPRGAAALPDHLKCYKIKDPLKVKHTVDLTPEQTQFLKETGCVVKCARTLGLRSVNDSSMAQSISASG